jgi:AcrR family transcriptional regulator
MSSPAVADRRVARGEATRAQILAAAREILKEQGHAAMTTRAVADRAGVQLSLVHYHFGGKRGLLVAVLEYENDRLLARQRELYAGPDPFSQKWRTACEYLREDMRSGYARILWELWAAGLADDELAERWRSAIRQWRQLVEGVIQDWAEELRLELPVSPRVIVTLAANIFWGAEVEMLAGVTEEEAPHFEGLEALARLIESLESPPPTL